MKRLIGIVILTLSCACSNAQVDIARLDTALWEVDTISSVALVFPKFEFESDTAITFVDSSKKAAERLLTLNYRQGAAYVVGDYSDANGVESVYLFLNVLSENLNHRRLQGLVDTVFHHDYGSRHCVSLQSLGFRNDAVRNKINTDNPVIMENEWIILSRQLLSEDTLQGCLFRFAQIHNPEPPYEVILHLIPIDFSK